MENLIEKLKAAKEYCIAARRAEQLSLCKLLIRDEIQPIIEATIDYLLDNRPINTSVLREQKIIYVK